MSGNLLQKKLQSIWRQGDTQLPSKNLRVKASSRFLVPTPNNDFHRDVAEHITEIQYPST